MTLTHPSSPDFFEAKYKEAEDPWNFATEASELQRYNHILGALSHQRYNCAFEPGCSVGVLTEKLAASCDRIEALDFSPSASAHARGRCAHLPQVRVSCAGIPDRLPPADADLLILSEIGYYFSLPDWDRVARALTAPLQNGATVLAAHWLGASEDHLISGDQVHEVLLSFPHLRLDHSERHGTFRLDRMVRR